MYKKRNILAALLKQKSDKKISLLIGPRQVGKTTLLKMIFAEINTEGPCLMLDMDVLSNYDRINSFEKLVNTITLHGYRPDSEHPFYLFIDEFQRFPVLTVILKNVFDHLPNVKVYASGSSSLHIKKTTQESLAGRKIINEIWPLSFREFLEFRGETENLAMLANVPQLIGEGLESVMKDIYNSLSEFLLFGGYPEVALSSGHEKKIQVLESIFDLYISKDLIDYLNISKILDVKILIELLAINNGQKIKLEEIAAATSIKTIEVKNYTELLQETYIIRNVRPFFTNKNKELVKIPKVYFIDPGVRNYFVRNFTPINLRPEAGFLFETFILGEMIKSGVKEINFWQDKNRREVDFVLHDSGKVFPVEVKYKSSVKRSEVSGLESFLAGYPKAGPAILINLGIQNDSGLILYRLPFFKFRTSSPRQE